ncbi:major facilitator superfamily domain-containing protein [Phycomyces nitens]|nr:major facilitator superfamily domain-containing protein [Phycomyces nitens]
MVGNIASTLIWLFSRSFSTFLLARLIGGLSEGNVQLSIAIISDITLPERRSRNLALVGIAFAVAFTFGPPLGAWFASIDLAKIYPETVEWGIYPYSMPALVAMGLLVIETVYLAKYLPETRHQKSIETSEPKTSGAAAASQDSQGSVETRLSNLRRLNILQCLFSLLFSGMEFTLVFLTFDVLDYSHMQQGKLLGTMGIMSSLIQGGYVRRKVQVVGEKALVIQGMVACVVGLGCLAITALRVQQAWLYCGVCFLAFTSGTVVNCLTSLASLQCDDDHAENNRLAKGRALGEFRSFGQLGRALGPVSACGLYWMTGPVCCYSAGAIVMTTIAILTALWAPLRRIKSD